MSRLTWGEASKRLFESGVDRGVFYPRPGAGVAWNGLISIKEDVDETEQTLTYFDGVAVQNQIAIGEFKASLAAMTYPAEFEPYDGYTAHLFFEQNRKPFDLCYRTLVGDGSVGLDLGYKLHLVYNALAAPSGMVHATTNDNVEIAALQWGITTIPTPVVDKLAPLGGGVRPSSHVILDSTIVNDGVMAAVEAILYGQEIESDARMPSIQELLDILEPFAKFRIIDHGDGSFTAIGPDEAVSLTAPTVFQLAWPSVFLTSSDTYRASSF